ncbi:Plant self-incompatibility S1 [Arabidopsis suecica]|uniref:S-protein homolog n=1 Tax=Arabidopsis suecica TaxID=45249 RepID=A0A8T2BFI3_ARASU|nr:Plant self-incompatibility S1 [Arabidopsis suecica]
MNSSSLFSIIFSVTFVVILFGGLCKANRVVQVDIINDIGSNIQLGLHCKSKHKDLGSQSLAQHQHWGFRENLNFWETTLFFCHFVWENQSKWFDILEANRDKDICEHHPCVWSVRPSGPCRLTGTEKCFPWN